MYFTDRLPLNDLSALTNLIAIGGHLQVNNNDALTSLTGLDNIGFTTISHLELIGSSTLSTCSVPSICDYLYSNGSVTISANMTNCNSIAEVQNNCPPPVPTICIWQGGGGDWNQHSNWSCGHIPFSFDEVIVASGNPQINNQVILSDFTLDNSVIVGGSGSLLIESGSVDWNGGSVDLDLTIKTGSQLNISSIDPSVQNYNGNLIIEPGAIVNHSGTLTYLHINSGSITNNGTYNYSGGSVSLNNSTLFDNFGTLDASVDGLFTSANGCNSMFSNKPTGVFTKSSGSSELTFSIKYENFGNTNINAGSLKFNCDFDLGGTINGIPGSKIIVNNGTVNLKPNPSSSDYNKTGSLLTTIASNVTLEKTGSGTFVVNGILIIDGSLILND